MSPQALRGAQWLKTWCSCSALACKPTQSVHPPSPPSPLHPFQALRDAQWLAESNRDNLVQLFRTDLEAQVERLNKEVKDISLLAQHDMILDEHSREQQVGAGGLGNRGKWSRWGQ